MFSQGKISLPLLIYNVFTWSNQYPFIALQYFYGVKWVVKNGVLASETLNFKFPIDFLYTNRFPVKLGTNISKILVTSSIDSTACLESFDGVVQHNSKWKCFCTAKIVVCCMYIVSQSKTLSPDLEIYLVWNSSVGKFTLVSWTRLQKDELLSYLLQMAVTTWTFCLLLKVDNK